jgi:hypothetical protein
LKNDLITLRLNIRLNLQGALRVMKYSKLIIFSIVFLILSFRTNAFEQSLNCKTSGKSAVLIRSLKFAGKGELPDAGSDDVSISGIADEINFAKFKFKNVKISGTASGSPKGPYYELKADEIKEIQSIFINKDLEVEVTDSKGNEYKAECN